MTKQTFINAYWPSAQEATAGTPIFPDTVITAAFLESGAGESGLTRQANNFFGFKSSPAWMGATITMPTKEVINGQTITVNAVFRKYYSPMESFRDYVRLLQTTRYVNAGVTKSKTPDEQFTALQKAGYATDPSYAQKLSNLLNSLKSFFVNNPVVAAAAGGGVLAVIAVILIVLISKSKMK